MGHTVAHKLIAAHLLAGNMEPGQEIGIRIDQTLTQDATGTLVMLELEAMGLERTQAELSAQYLDHNLIQEDYKNPDDHLFLHSACQRFGLWYSRPGNGVSHPVHMERFGIPGKSLLGSDSHTCAAGSLGMLAIGAGGVEVALAMVGEPFYFQMPTIWGVQLTGQLPDWVSAKDVILEMLRRHGVKGASGSILEYHGPGLQALTAMDRHVIANMGAELGATTTVFPSDEATRQFLKAQRREHDWSALGADEDASYDLHDEINLSELEPLIAMPSSPGNVVPVREVAGQEIYQAYIGSSANPGYRDFAVVAEMVQGKHTHPRVSLDINPTSRQILANLTGDGHLVHLITAGARLHQAGCNGCIGMGQAPATDKISLRTVPRNFPGRSGTPEDKVCLVSPETAAASALQGVITDPRDLQMKYPRIQEPDQPEIDLAMLIAPPSPEESRNVSLEKGPNVVSLPKLEPLPNKLELPVLLKVGDDVSTDEILPAGANVLPLRSNVPAISRFCFAPVDKTYPDRAEEVWPRGGHVVIGGENYGQGSSREHAALAPRYLGLRIVLAKSFARIHWQNLVNFGVLPLTITEAIEQSLSQSDVLRFADLDQLRPRMPVRVENLSADGQPRTFEASHFLSDRQINVVKHGGIINWIRERLPASR